MKWFLILLFACVQGKLFSQDVSELEKRYGFKDIKLEMPIDSVKGIKFKKDILEAKQYPAKLYEVDHPDYASIGEVKVKDIQLKTYKDKVYEIHLITEKDPRLMKALESIYGKADYDMRAETYFWKSPIITLKFISSGKHQLQLTYSATKVYSQMKEDKKQKVDDIADDF